MYTLSLHDALPIYRPAGGQRPREGGGRGRLDADDPDVGTAGPHGGRDAGDQAPAAGADDDGGDVGALVEDLQADRALPGDHGGVVERVDRSEEGRVGKECRSRWSPYH